MRESSAGMVRYPEHLRGFDYVGPYRYFLTFCTRDRRPHFADTDIVALVCDQFVRAARETGMVIVAYCFMPDHVHLLVEGIRDDADLRQFIRSAKQLSGYHANRRTRGSLWQRYGYERVLRSDEATQHVAGYLVANPVRAGLVESLDAYPHWGSSVYTREELLEYARRTA